MEIDLRPSYGENLVLRSRPAFAEANRTRRLFTFAGKCGVPSYADGSGAGIDRLVRLDSFCPGLDTFTECLADCVSGRSSADFAAQFSSR